MAKTAKGNKEQNKQKYVKVIRYVKVGKAKHYSVRDVIMTEEQSKKEFAK